MRARRLRWFLVLGGTRAVWPADRRGPAVVRSREVPVRFGWRRVVAAWAVAGSLIAAAAVAAGAQGSDTFDDIGDAGEHAGSVETLMEAGGSSGGPDAPPGRSALMSRSIVG